MEKCRCGCISNQKKKVLLKFDPPITEKWEYQAEMAGQKLRIEIEEFTNLSKKKLKIYQLILCPPHFTESSKLL